MRSHKCYPKIISRSKVLFCLFRSPNTYLRSWKIELSQIRNTHLDFNTVFCCDNYFDKKCSNKKSKINRKCIPNPDRKSNAVLGRFWKEFDLQHEGKTVRTSLLCFVSDAFWANEVPQILPRRPTTTPTLLLENIFIKFAIFGMKFGWILISVGWIRDFNFLCITASWKLCPSRSTYCRGQKKWAAVSHPWEIQLNKYSSVCRKQYSSAYWKQ